MKIPPIILGLMTYVPGASKILSKRTGGTDSARYCYSIWLRHMVMAYENNLSTNPKVIAELGPGDSIGIGLAALISGAEQYYALDVVKYASTPENLEIFDGLVDLFRKKQAIPAGEEFPLAKPHLASYRFPDYILTDNWLKDALAITRIEKIKKSIMDINTSGSMIKYKAPWFESGTIEKESVDMIYSQAVLEHVDDLSSTYKTLCLWLKPGGFMSHQIDFKCHGTTDEWNGHWACSDFVWSLIRGRRKYLLNREPFSTHVKLLENSGFKIIFEQRVKSPSKFTAHDLGYRFKNMSEDDLTTSDVFIQVQKKSL